MLQWLLYTVEPLNVVIKEAQYSHCTCVIIQQIIYHTLGKIAAVGAGQKYISCPLSSLLCLNTTKSLQGNPSRSWIKVPQNLCFWKPLRFRHLKYQDTSMDPKCVLVQWFYTSSILEESCPGDHLLVIVTEAVSTFCSTILNELRSRQITLSSEVCQHVCNMLGQA